MVQLSRAIWWPTKVSDIVVSIEFSPLSSVELTTSWYQLHNGDYKGILLRFVGFIRFVFSISVKFKK